MPASPTFFNGLLAVEAFDQRELSARGVEQVIAQLRGALGLLGGLLAALWLIIGTLGTPFLMQALICSGSPLSGGGGSAMQQFYMLHQLAFIAKSLKTGGAAAPALAARGAAGAGSSGGGNGSLSITTSCKASPRTSMPSQKV